MNPTINRSIWFLNAQNHNQCVWELISQIPIPQQSTDWFLKHREPKQSNGLISQSPNLITQSILQQGRRGEEEVIWINFQTPRFLFCQWECQSTRVSESKVSCWPLIYHECMLLVPCALGLPWSWWKSVVNSCSLRVSLLSLDTAPRSKPNMMFLFFRGIIEKQQSQKSCSDLCRQPIGESPTRFFL